MTKKIIQIGADVEDTYFKFPQEVMSDIVDSLYKNNKIEIHFTEGIALEELNIMEKKFLDIFYINFYVSYSIFYRSYFD